MITELEIFNTKDNLPNNKEYVLIHITKTNWGDDDDPKENRYWRVAKFVKGISKVEREKMASGELPDEDTVGFIFPTPPGEVIQIKSKRSKSHRSEDEGGNNHKPYNWEEFGPSSYFGQEVDYWCRLPNIDLINSHHSLE